MEYCENLVKGLIYMASFIIWVMSVSMCAVLIKAFKTSALGCGNCKNNKNCLNTDFSDAKEFSISGYEVCKSNPCNKLQKNKPKYAENIRNRQSTESDEARKLRIELENIDAFYTDAMQKEVE